MGHPSKKDDQSTSKKDDQSTSKKDKRKVQSQPPKPKGVVKLTKHKLANAEIAGAAQTLTSQDDVNEEHEMVGFKSESVARYFVFQYADFHQRTEVVCTDGTLTNTGVIVTRRRDMPLPLGIGSVVEVVTAKSKRATARRYMGTIIKGPFANKSNATGAATLTNVHAPQTELPRTCASCRSLMVELQREKSLSDTLRGELRALRTSEAALREQNHSLVLKTRVNAKTERKLVLQIDREHARANNLLRNSNMANALLTRASHCLQAMSSQPCSAEAASATEYLCLDGDAQSDGAAADALDVDADDEVRQFSADRNLSVVETRALLRACDKSETPASDYTPGADLVPLSEKQNFMAVSLPSRTELDERHKDYRVAMQAPVDLDNADPRQLEATRRVARLALLRALFRAIFTADELANSSLSGRKISGYVSSAANPAKVTVANQWIKNAGVQLSSGELHRAFTRCGETARLQLGLPKRVRPKKSTGQSLMIIESAGSSNASDTSVSAPTVAGSAGPAIAGEVAAEGGENDIDMSHLDGTKDLLLQVLKE